MSAGIEGQEQPGAAIVVAARRQAEPLARADASRRRHHCHPRKGFDRSCPEPVEGAAV
jgi:hypothetical protein